MTLSVPERALSLSAPWGYFMINLPEPHRKPVENRLTTFSHKSFRGHVWVHQTKPKRIADFHEACAFAIDRGVPRELLPRFSELNIGGIIGRFEIYDRLKPPVWTGERPDRWRMIGHFGFLTRDARAVPFTACRGMLGFWRVPADVLAQLEAAA